MLKESMDKCSGLVAKLSKQVGDSKASLAQLEDEIQAEAGANGAQEESVREHVSKQLHTMQVALESISTFCDQASAQVSNLEQLCTCPQSPMPKP